MPYQPFTTARLTEPDRATLIAQLKALDATAGVQHVPGSPSYTIKKATPWTAPQITQAQNVIDTAPETTPTMRYQRTSRDKDILATIALIVRAKNTTAWNGMTTAQKVSATLAEADVWVSIRDFLETNA